MITYVVHWVDEPLLHGKGHGVPIDQMLEMFRESAPGKHLFLTDMDTSLPEGWDTLRVPRDGQNVMGHMMLARAEACKFLEGNVIFADADTLVIKDPSELFRGEWSMAVPWFPRYLSGVMLCQDVTFAEKFFREAYERICGRPAVEQLFGADLSVTKEMIEENDAGFFKETQDRICRTAPNDVGEYAKWKPEQAYLVNFKGMRKRFMKTAFNKMRKDIADFGQLPAAKRGAA